MLLSKQGRAWRSGLLEEICGTIFAPLCGLLFNPPLALQCVVINLCTTLETETQAGTEAVQPLLHRYFNGERGPVSPGQVPHAQQTWNFNTNGILQVMPLGAESLRRSSQTLSKAKSSSGKSSSPASFMGTLHH